MSKFAKENYSKKTTFLYFSPGNHLIIFYQLTKLEAPSLNCFRDIFITSFQCTNSTGAITQKIYFYICSPGSQIIIFYQLTKLEVPTCSCNNLSDILITKFHSELLKGT